MVVSRAFVFSIIRSMSALPEEAVAMEMIANVWISSAWQLLPVLHASFSILLLTSDVLIAQTS